MINRSIIVVVVFQKHVDFREKESDGVWVPEFPRFCQVVENVPKTVGDVQSIQENVVQFVAEIREFERIRILNRLNEGVAYNVEYVFRDVFRSMDELECLDFFQVEHGFRGNIVFRVYRCIGAFYGDDFARFDDVVWQKTHVVRH